MNKKIITLLFPAFLLFCNNAYSAIGAWKDNQNHSAQTRLIASFYQDADGEKKLVAGLQFKMGAGWKIYGPRSEGIGMPPSLDFSQSKNYLNHQIIWPSAVDEEEKIGQEVIRYSAYHDEVILPIEINVKDLTHPIELALKVNYGLCKDICIPANEDFSLTVSTNEDPAALALIQKFYPAKKFGDQNKQEEPVVATHSITLISAIILAIIGGAILNIMPCVLPVLSIKLLSIINHSDAKISRIRFAFFATICGIISCFLVFATFASIIKFTGNSLGWGLQFQSPYFLIFLITILVFFIANLLGVFEISFDRFLATFLNKKVNEAEDREKIFVPNFLSGILAVLLSTPCSAPFLGSAISFALTQKIEIIILIFLAIGFGFAAPYVILLITPKLVYLLPKPGSWMLKTRKIMALLLALTVAWLVYVLYGNLQKAPAVQTVESVKKHEKIWQEFDEEKLYSLAAQNKVVVIDVTAAWCLTCKANKIIVLDSKEIVEKLNSPNIVAMRADITKPDEKVMNFLRKHKRFAIPFNVVYGPGAKDGLLTSELLNKKDLLKIIDQATKQ